MVLLPRGMQGQRLQAGGGPSAVLFSCGVTADIDFPALFPVSYFVAFLKRLTEGSCTPTDETFLVTYHSLLLLLLLSCISIFPHISNWGICNPTLRPTRGAQWSWNVLSIRKGYEQEDTREGNIRRYFVLCCLVSLVSFDIRSLHPLDAHGAVRSSSGDELTRRERQRGRHTALSIRKCFSSLTVRRQAGPGHRILIRCSMNFVGNFPTCCCRPRSLMSFRRSLVDRRDRQWEDSGADRYQHQISGVSVCVKVIINLAYFQQNIAFRRRCWRGSSNSSRSIRDFSALI